MPKLIVLVGVQNSGKSTFSKKYCKDNNIIRLSSDELRGVISGDEKDQTKNYVVFSTIKHAAAHLLAQGHSVLIDSCAQKPNRRKDFINIGKKYGAEVIGFYFKVSLEICKTRNKLRERFVPEEIIERFYNELEEPSLTEGFDIVNFINENGEFCGGIIPSNVFTYENLGCNFGKILEDCEKRFTGANLNSVFRKLNND